MTGLVSCRAALALLIVTAPAAFAQQKAEKAHQQGGAMSASMSKAKVKKMSNAEIIRSALSAGPREIAEHAAVIAPDANGKMATIRAGTNGWTCMADEPDTPGLDPMCVDQPSMQWVQSWMAKAPKPANTVPGIIYMLQGGSDISATNPWATTTDHFIESPPHFMIMWPYDAKSTGFSTTPKKTGTWIMWAGTPYAHLMINQKP
ncbi:MAG TPA: hypothetical protein VFS59_15245 [Gemmatimonadaceae bacterium]|nr:hypothetical protein [Gemmatimonadaceae bacterium]